MKTVNKSFMQKSFMQQALNDQWQQLPQALKNHYRESQAGHNNAKGHMNIEYPWFMQWILNLFYFLGILVNRKGQMVQTEVKRTTKNGRQHWHRVMTFSDGEVKKFHSTVIFDDKTGCFTEFVNSYLGLRMRVRVHQGMLCYESVGYVVKIKQYSIPIPEWLALGHVTIKETHDHIDDHYTFNMDFRLKHWLFGEIFCYRGRFTTQVLS